MLIANELLTTKFRRVRSTNDAVAANQRDYIIYP